MMGSHSVASFISLIEVENYLVKVLSKRLRGTPKWRKMTVRSIPYGIEILDSYGRGLDSSGIKVRIASKMINLSLFSNKLHGQT